MRGLLARIRQQLKRKAIRSFCWALFYLVLGVVLLFWPATSDMGMFCLGVGLTGFVIGLQDRQIELQEEIISAYKESVRLRDDRQKAADRLIDAQKNLIEVYEESMPRACRKCGRMMPANINFCGHCGAIFKELKYA